MSPFTRRSLLALSAGLLVPKLAWVETHSELGLCWTLDDAGDTAKESVERSSDAIASRTGHAIWVGEGKDRALRLDGYSVWIDHPPSEKQPRKGPLTLGAWVALESYPVNEAALVQCATPPEGGFRFSIDKWGYLHLRVQSDGTSKTCASQKPVPRGQWIHLAASISLTGELALYQDGEACGKPGAPTADLHLGDRSGLLIGKSTGSEVIGELFPTGTLNGLIKDVRIYQAQLPQTSIARLMTENRPAGTPDLEINGPWCASDPQRPRLHAMPPRAWTNEPHGLIHWQGLYHLFYQKNANGPYWGNINWGHMTSPDLYRWTEMPVALWPEPGADEEGCWSGSVIDHDGKLAILYTAGGSRSSICLAQSADGIHFEKYPGNPIIPAVPSTGGYPEFRDPFVWCEGSTYYLLIGSAVKGVGGTALLYSSQDLIHWDFRKPLLVGDRETSGIFWEMPIFVKLGERHALIVCEVPGRASYWVGTWQNEVFIPETKEPHRLELFNHLLSPTPYTSSQGEVLVMGIIPDQRSPKECWRAGYAHLYSLPRRLVVGEAGKLEQLPHEANATLFEEPAHFSDLVIEEGPARSIGETGGSCLRVQVTLQRGASRAVSLLLRRSPDDREHTVLRYEWEIGRLVLDRSKSSLDPTAVHDLLETTYFAQREDVIEFDLFLDESVLEVFVERRAAFAARIYPTLDTSIGLAVSCFGGAAKATAVTIARARKA